MFSLFLQPNSRRRKGRKLGKNREKGCWNKCGDQKAKWGFRWGIVFVITQPTSKYHVK